MSSDHTGPSSQQPELIDQIAQAVCATPGVHTLHAGGAGQVATYLPGRRVGGIRAVGNGYDVHVTLAWGFPVVATGEAVRSAVQAVTPGRVDVTVEDVAPPAQQQP